MVQCQLNLFLIFQVFLQKRLKWAKVAHLGLEGTVILTNNSVTQNQIAELTKDRLDIDDVGAVHIVPPTP